ncbi:aspartate dehydrogenase [Solibacillus isronensis]|uniref:aspartate dehydrogenase n=1 Tax=Solibacillus isronensis TaxID=412383 RepID=UPI00203F56BE|nr:aspartate dehydrogenase [Solibacillus isronensis]MCM3723400.1 aspartate dehydrogenase [Solibacillus isronensis]
MKIGLIGAGAIAHFLLEEINEKRQENLRITSVFVRDREKHHLLESNYGVKVYTEIDAFLDSEIDIVVEAANIEAVHTLLPSAIRKKDVVLISIGALVDEELLAELNTLANEFNRRLYLPSGAIGGLDLLQNAHVLGTVTSVALTTRKPASSLIEETIEKEKVIFEGSATEAIRRYPKNMNVSIVLALAGIGFDETSVTLVADPKIDKNIHQIEMTGDFGEATFTIKNNPLPANPKTSYLAAMSILGTLKRINRKLLTG